MKFYISKSGTKLVKAELELETETENDYYGTETESLQMTIVLGKKLDGVGEKSLTIETETSNSDYDKSESIEIVYDIEQNDNKAFVATLSFENSNEKNWNDGYDPYEDTEEGEIEFNWDKKSGEFTIEYEGVKSEWQDSDPYLTIEFNMLDNGDTRTIILEDIDYNSGYDYGYSSADYEDNIFKTIEDMEITIILDRNDKAPAPAKDFTELTELDEEDIDEILDDYEEELADILEDNGITDIL